MSRGLNKVMLIGHLGADPDTRYTTEGKAVTSVRLATSEAWKDKQTGEQQERTEWHRLTFFGRLAEVAAEYLKKGSKIYAEGKLRTTEYEKDGVKRYSTDIVVDEMMMLDGRNDAQPRSNGNGQRASASQQPAHERVPVPGRTAEPAFAGDDFDSVPF